MAAAAHSIFGRVIKIRVKKQTPEGWDTEVISYSFDKSKTTINIRYLNSARQTTEKIINLKEFIGDFAYILISEENSAKENLDNAERALKKAEEELATDKKAESEKEPFDKIRRLRNTYNNCDYKLGEIKKANDIRFIEELEKRIVDYVKELRNADAAIAIQNKNVAISALQSYCCNEENQDNLDAAKKVISWLNNSQIALRAEKQTPPLGLTPKDIKSLTKENLGKKIGRLIESDNEFKIAFEKAELAKAQAEKDKEQAEKVKAQAEKVKAQKSVRNYQLNDGQIKSQVTRSSDKLNAVTKIVAWIADSEAASQNKKPLPPLDLTPKDIKSLTNGKLGDKIKELAKADNEFKMAFEKAKAQASLREYQSTLSTKRECYIFWSLPCSSSASKTKNLDAVTKVIDWLDNWKKASEMGEPAPALVLTPADIRALTHDDLGKKINDLVKSNKEFGMAFENAKNHPYFPELQYRSLKKAN